MSLIASLLELVGLAHTSRAPGLSLGTGEQQRSLSKHSCTTTPSDSQARIQTALPLIDCRAVARYHFPLMDHGLRVRDPLVSIGDAVIVGQSLAEGIVSSVHGTVERIEAMPFAHASGLPALTVTIYANTDTDTDTDTDNSSVRAGIGERPTRKDPTTHALTIEQLQRCGVNGLGGAGYSTAEKLSAIHRYDIKTLLINAAECDPGIRCDEALMVNEADSVISGIHQLIGLSKCQNCILAIEHDKSDAIAALHTAIQDLPDAPPIELQLIAPVYPSGAERLLISLTCGIDVVPPQRPAEQGVLCVNVATAHAAGRAAEGQALTTRIVTIGGAAARHPCNVRVRLGTPVSALFESSGNHYDPERHCLRIGGSISGYELLDANAPVTATTNCITLDMRTIKPAALPCIRCGACSDVCPVHLLPQQLYWHMQAGDLEGATRQRVDHCIECACCDLVCPSSIELTNLFRHARSERHAQSRQQRDAELARQRHESHTQRETAREALEQEQIQARKSALNDRAAASAAALERVRKRRKRPPS